jgi:hypothetical protein
MHHPPAHSATALPTLNFGIPICGKVLKLSLIRDWLVLTAMLGLSPFTWGQSIPSETPAGTGIPPKAGWYEIPNTQLAPHCPADPSIEGNSGCRAVVNAWNGGVADTKRNRLIIWGGGHGDYYGNEVYGLDLNSMKMSRLTEPSPVTNVTRCPEAYDDGRPSSRHTYNGLAYLAGQHKMFVFGGSKANCGFMSADTWALDLAKMEWRNMDPHGADSPSNNPGVTADYDPNSGMVFLSDTANFFRYDPAKNAYTRLKPLSGVDYRLSGVIDPKRKLFFMVGGPGQFWAIDIQPGSNFTAQDWSHKVTGCEPLLHALYPGLAFDPERKLIVGWAGGDTVYLFHSDTRACTSESYPGGPGPEQANGTFGRFRYFPELGVFALVNDWKQNAFLLRLAPSTNPVATPAQPSNN